MTPRLQPLPERGAGPLARLLYRITRRKTGRMLDPIAIYAYRPGLLLGYGLVELASERGARVPARLRALAVLKSAALQGCEFCCDIGSHEARQAGIGTEELLDLPHYATSDRFDELDKLVLDYAVAMTRTPVDVDDALFARLRGHFDDGQIVELTHMVALENLRSRFNAAFGIGPAGFSAGMVCAVPEPGVAAAAPSSAGAAGAAGADSSAGRPTEQEPATA